MMKIFHQIFIQVQKFYIDQHPPYLIVVQIQFQHVIENLIQQQQHLINKQHIFHQHINEMKIFNNHFHHRYYQQNQDDLFVILMMQMIPIHHQVVLSIVMINNKF